MSVLIWVQTVCKGYQQTKVFASKEKVKRGVQCLSGRVFDSRWRGCGFKPHQQHSIVSLSKTLIPCFVLVQPRKTHPDMTEKMLTGM